MKMSKIAVLAVITVSLAIILFYVVSNSDGSKIAAEKFIQVYYTVETTSNTELRPDNPALEQALKVKYGELLTQSNFDDLVANRLILENELLAEATGQTISVKNIILKKDNTNSENMRQYLFTATIVLKSASNTKEITQTGVITLKKEDALWKANYFMPDTSLTNDVGI